MSRRTRTHSAHSVTRATAAAATAATAAELGRSPAEHARATRRTTEYYFAIALKAADEGSAGEDLDLKLERIPIEGSETAEVWLWVNGVPVVLTRQLAAVVLQGFLSWATEDTTRLIDALASDAAPAPASGVPVPPNPPPS